MRTAGLGDRILAAVIDAAIFCCIGIPFYAPLLGQGGRPRADYGELAHAAAQPQTLAAFGVMLAYYVLMEVLANGQTVGKMLIGIRVVKVDGSRVDLGASLVRNLLRFVDYWCCIPVGIVAIAISATNQRVGDMLAGTIVVRAR